MTGTAWLHATLEQGESLTTMYMRINAPRFDPETARELADADGVDDELIRCPFS